MTPQPIAPLASLTVIEFEGLGPAPLAGRLLAQAGASVTVIARPGAGEIAARVGGGADGLRAGKRMLALDLKQAAGRDSALELVAGADALIEGFRPGVMERLGLGPAECHARRPALVYGRLSGWGRSGPLADAAGHDLNYAALSGLLTLGLPPGTRPAAPPTVLADGGGALGLAWGLVCGVLHARLAGQGSVVDAALMDVPSLLGGIALWARAGGSLGGEGAARPSPFHDSPFYDVYACADGRWISVAALEPAFYAEWLDRLGLHDVDPAAQYDTTQWPALKRRVAALFATRPQADWCARLEGGNACVAPVLTPEEAAAHPQHQARGLLAADARGQAAAAGAPRWWAAEPAAGTSGYQASPAAGTGRHQPSVSPPRGR